MTPHFLSKPSFQELYTGCGIYISNVEFHNILTTCGYDPKKIIGNLIKYYFDERMLATHSPFCEDRSSKKSKKLDGRITHAIEGMKIWWIFFFVLKLML